MPRSGGTEIDAVVAPVGVPTPGRVARRADEAAVRPAQRARRADPEPYELAWMRARGDLGDDPALHACAFAYLSDEFPLGAALGAHPDRPGLGARLHREPRPRDLVPPRLPGRRVAAVRAAGRRSRRRPRARHGPDLRRAGRHVASIAQEALGRERRPGLTDPSQNDRRPAEGAGACRKFPRFRIKFRAECGRSNTWHAWVRR